MINKVEHVAVYFGSGYIKAVSSKTGKHIKFPSIVKYDSKCNLLKTLNNSTQDINGIYNF